MAPPSHSPRPANEVARRASALRYRALVDGSPDIFIALAAEVDHESEANSLEDDTSNISH